MLNLTSNLVFICNQFVRNIKTFGHDVDINRILVRVRCECWNIKYEGVLCKLYSKLGLWGNDRKEDGSVDSFHSKSNVCPKTGKQNNGMKYKYHSI